MTVAVVVVITILLQLLIFLKPALTGFRSGTTPPVLRIRTCKASREAQWCRRKCCKFLQPARCLACDWHWGTAGFSSCQSRLEEDLNTLAPWNCFSSCQSRLEDLNTLAPWNCFCSWQSCAQDLTNSRHQTSASVVVSREHVLLASADPSYSPLPDLVEHRLLKTDVSPPLAHAHLFSRRRRDYRQSLVDCEAEEKCCGYGVILQPYGQEFAFL